MVSVVLPLLLAVSAEVTAEDPACDWTGSTQQKVAGLATIWAEARHGFPSFDAVPDLDWDASFEEFVPRVIASETLDEYYWTLMEFAGLLEDGHTSVLPPWGHMRPDYDNPPLEVQVVDGAFLIARAAMTPEIEAAGVVVGDEILSVDGIDVRIYFEDSVNRYYPRGSAHANYAVNVVYLLRGPVGSTVTLGIRDAMGEERDVTLTRDWMTPDAGPFFPRILLALMADPAMEIVPLEGGITLIRLHNFDNPSMGDQFLQFIDRLDEEGTTGLVFDLRFCMGGRGDIAEKMIGALIEEPVSSPLWRYPKHIPAEANWGRLPEPGEASNTIRPRDGKRYSGPVVVLTSGVTSSTAEDLPISLREAGRAILVGENTAGSAGNPVEHPLPGGGTFGMATFRAYLPDGGEYVGIGVAPDIVVAPSAEDIRNGTDPVLGAALEVLTICERHE
jgi:C-terminal processing protease CtpA/Prc